MFLSGGFGRESVFLLFLAFRLLIFLGLWPLHLWYKKLPVESSNHITVMLLLPLWSIIKDSSDYTQRRWWQPTPALLPGKSHGWRSLVGCSPWGLKESETTEWLHFHFSLSCVGERNGNPLQCSCLENPRDGEAWWAAVYGVAQSRTWLKRLSSRSSSIDYKVLCIQRIEKSSLCYIQ